MVILIADGASDLFSMPLRLYAEPISHKMTRNGDCCKKDKKCKQNININNFFDIFFLKFQFQNKSFPLQKRSFNPKPNNLVDKQIQFLRNFFRIYIICFYAINFISKKGLYEKKYRIVKIVK